MKAAIWETQRGFFVSLQLLWQTSKIVRPRRGRKSL